MIDQLTVTPIGGPPYEVLMGAGILERAATFLDGATRVAMLISPHVANESRRLAAVLEAAGATVLEIVLPAGEAAKDLEVAGNCWDALGAAGFTRDDLIIGFGGGATTDLAGFVAATWLRGIAVLQVPTTTAGMVDAAIGGKTAINSPAGKNLIGAFHQPRAVIADLELLATLPPADHRAGLAEVVKCGFIRDTMILGRIEADPDAAMDVSSELVAELVHRSVRVKAQTVSVDTRETGLREILNYGHTLGHAIERAEHYTWRHGDAVSIGMVFAAALSAAAGRLPHAEVQRHRNILQSLQLPTEYDGADRDELLTSMRVDKKSRADRLRFVILENIGQPVILENPEPAWLDAAFEAVGR